MILVKLRGALALQELIMAPFMPLWLLRQITFATNVVMFTRN